LHDEGYTVYGANGKIGFYSEYTHENPTIMITCRGATCGNVNISEPKAYINGNAMALDEINPKEIDINYLKYCLVDRGFRDVISGSAQPQITGQGLSKIKIPLPPLVTQKQIAAVLEKADQLRKDCKQMEQELNSLAQSVFIDMFGDPVTNPKGWDLRALGNLCEKITDGTHKTPTYMNDGVKFLSAKNISSGEINWTNTKYISKAEHQELIKRCNPEIGDVLLAKSGTIGIAAMVNRDIEFSLFESAALIKYKRNLLGAEYVLALLNSESIKQLYRRQTKGNSIKHLHLVDIRSLEVPAPPMGIQKEFENKIKALHSLRANNRLLAQENEMNFNALMQKAFKGELSLKSIKKVA
jgi:type I restriction enzyme S subunit